MIEVAHETGTVAVIKSPHLDLLTPRVSRTGRCRILHHLNVTRKAKKKKTIINTKINQSQY
jgi:hypothetical protein